MRFNGTLLISYMFLFNMASSSSFPNLMVQILFYQNSTGPNFRKVGKSLADIFRCIFPGLNPNCLTSLVTDSLTVILKGYLKYNSDDKKKSNTPANASWQIFCLNNSCIICNTRSSRGGSGQLCDKYRFPMGGPQ